jgi:hypothetical protein
MINKASKIWKAKEALTLELSEPGSIEAAF